MNGLKPNEQRGRIAIVQLWIVLLLNIIIFIIKLSLTLIDAIVAASNIIPDILYYVYYIFHHTAGFIGLVYLAAWLTCTITFIRWFRRAYYNLGLLTNERRYNDSWAAKGWFIPFMNLYVPYRIMKELYTKTDKYLLERHLLLLDSKESYTKRLNTNIVKWWWALMIMAGAIYCFQFMLGLVLRDYMLVITSNVVYFLARTGLIIVLGIVTISLMRNYHETEKLLYEEAEDETEI